MINLNKEKFSSLRLICPTIKLSSLYHKIVSPMFNQIRNLQIRIDNLRHTRDHLLPKLISGEIHVKEIEIHVNGVE